MMKNQRKSVAIMQLKQEEKEKGSKDMSAANSPMNVIPNPGPNSNSTAPPDTTQQDPLLAVSFPLLAYSPHYKPSSPKFCFLCVY